MALYKITQEKIIMMEEEILKIMVLDIQPQALAIESTITSDKLTAKYGIYTDSMEPVITPYNKLYYGNGELLGDLDLKIIREKDSGLYDANGGLIYSKDDLKSDKYTNAPKAGLIGTSLLKEYARRHIIETHPLPKLLPWWSVKLGYNLEISDMDSKSVDECSEIIDDLEDIISEQAIDLIIQLKKFIGKYKYHIYGIDSILGGIVIKRYMDVRALQYMLHEELDEKLYE